MHILDIIHMIDISKYIYIYIYIYIYTFYNIIELVLYYKFI